MNGKKSKLLRRLAETTTIGQPNRKYQPEEVSSRKRRHALVFKLVPTCTRAKYQELKRKYKREVLCQL